MKPIEDLLDHLNRLDVKLWIDGENLRCNAPEGILTSSLQETLKNRKQELIEFLSENVEETKSYSTLPLLSNRKDLPLSFAQQRLFFLDRLFPDSPLYNSAFGLCIRGQLDVDALHQAINEIIKRHEILRTTFREKDGQVIQEIKSVVPLDMPLEYLNDLSEAQRETAAQEMASAEAQAPFDLEEGPLMRAILVQRGEEEYIFLLTMHHIIFDDWSLGIFNKELSILYRAFIADKPSPIPKLPIQYADFTVWQQRRLEGMMLDKQLAFWKKQLADLPVLQLPTDYRRPDQQTYRGSRYTFTLPTSLSAALRNLGRQQHSSFFMTLLSVFSVLLYRYTDRKDIVVGTPVAGRNRPELEELIGFFVNSLVLRIDLSGNPSFNELLRRVRNTVLDAFEHQDIPFERLVAELRPEPDPSRNPLFQVMLAVQKTFDEDLHLENAATSPLPADTKTAKFDLTLFFFDQDDKLSCSIEYNTDLFAQKTIKRLAGHLLTLTAGILANPDCPVAELPLLTQPERNQLLKTWNATSSEYPKDKCIQQVFEEQVEQNPDAVAVTYGNLSLTYKRLNLQANQLAHFLGSKGVVSGSLVGICMERSVEMIATLLGIEKAGGIYVPLDPEYPKERLAFMLEDAGISLLLIQPSFVEKFSGPELLVVHSSWKKNGFTGNTLANPACQGKSTDPAYVLYTSGSTGTPKGVSVSHRAINRLVCNTNYVQLTTNDRIGQASNTSFDAATFEIWGALLNGACLVGISRETLLSPALLTKQILRDKINTLFLTTALFNQFAREAPQMFKPLDNLLFGGEVVNLKWVQAVCRAGGPSRLLHVYGPTECTTFATWYLIKQDRAIAGTVPIGRPVANTEIYILDKLRQPVSIGIPGELYLGGDGLANGYLNRLELTNESFVANPFSDSPNSLIYKTGDVVRYLPDGNIIFLDRIDRQVKHRGFRIELGEIESVLTRHPAVSEVIILSRTAPSGSKYLSGWVVPLPDHRVNSSELQTYLQEKLPNYMLPSIITVIDSFPLTANGKVDRKALTDTTTPALDTTVLPSPPRNDIERRLVTIWERLLPSRPIGVKDNFFELGGHSLLAMGLLVEIEKNFNKKIALATFMEAPTIDQLKRCLTGSSTMTRSSLIFPLQAEGSRLPLFWAHGWPSECALHSYLHPDQPVYVISHQGADGKSPFYKTIEDIAAYHVEELLKLQAIGPYFLGGYSIGGMLVFEMAQQLLKKGEKIGLLFLLDPTEPTLPEIEKKVQNRVVHEYQEKAGWSNSIYLLLRWIKRNTWGIVQRKTRLMIKKGKILYCEILLAHNKTIPPRFRKVFNNSIYHDASYKYRPEKYVDTVILCKSANQKDTLSSAWQKLTGQNLRVHTMYKVDHLNLFKKPYIDNWVQKLRNSLDEKY